MVDSIGGEIDSAILRDDQKILQEWLNLQKEAGVLRTGRISEGELLLQSRDFLRLFRNALVAGGLDASDKEYEPAKELLADLSRSRALQGFSPTETASFIFSLKRPLIDALNRN